MIGGAVDANQKAETLKLRQMGYSVVTTSHVGRGFPDCIVGAPGIALLIEWKVSPKSKLSPAEVKFHREFKGPLIVATCAEQVHAEMQRLLA